MTPEQQRDALRREEEGREAKMLIEEAVADRRRRGFRLAEIGGEIVEVPREVAAE